MPLRASIDFGYLLGGSAGVRGVPGDFSFWIGQANGAQGYDVAPWNHQKIFIRSLHQGRRLEGNAKPDPFWGLTKQLVICGASLHHVASIDSATCLRRAPRVALAAMYA